MNWNTSEGKTLQRVLDENDRLDLAQSIVWMEQIASALAAAHEMGIVHRDIKPSNILINANSEAKLADFGLAKRVICDDTSAESLMGTPYFMAPELFRGIHASPQSDVYAFGIMFHFLLAGRPPYVDTSVSSVAILHATAEVPDTTSIRSDIPDALADFIGTCLAKEPENRFQDGVTLLKQLQIVTGSLRSAKSLILAAVEQDQLEFESLGEENYQVRVALDSGRFQTVNVRSRTDTIFHRRVISISSVCCEAESHFFEQALILNCAIPRGAIALEEIDGESHFVIADSLSQSTCAPEDISQSIASIAQHADQIEMLLTNRDVN